MATQLPPGWEERFDPGSARKYYVNHQTRQTSWTLPSESPLPAGWEQRFDPKGRVFFVNHDEGTTTWTDPRDQNTAPAPAPANTGPVSSPAATAPVKPAPKQYDTGTLVSFRRGAFWKKGLIVSSDYSGQVVFWEDGEQGIVDTALESRVVDQHQDKLEGLLEISDKALGAYPPNDNVARVSLLNIINAIRAWNEMYNSIKESQITDSMGELNKQLVHLIGFLQGKRFATVLTKSLQRGSHVAAVAASLLECTTELHRLAQPADVANLSLILRESGVMTQIVRALRAAESLDPLVNVLSFFAGDSAMIKFIGNVGGIRSLCALVENEAARQKAIVVLEQMLTSDAYSVAKGVRESQTIAHLCSLLVSNQHGLRAPVGKIVNSLFEKSNCAELVQCGAVEAVVPVLRTATRDAVSQVLSLLMLMTRAPDSIAALLHAQVGTACVELCGRFGGDHQMVLNVLQLLLAMVQGSPSSQASLMEQGVLALGIQMVRSSAGNEAVVREALNLLAAVASNNPKAQVVIRDAGGVDSLVSCIKSSFAIDVKLSAADALANLCTDPEVAKVAASRGAVVACIPLLARDSPKINALVSAMLQEPSVLRDTVVSLRSNSHSMSLMVKAFVKQLSSDKFCDSAMRALGAFCSLPTNDLALMPLSQRIQILVSTKAVPALVKIIGDKRFEASWRAAMICLTEVAKDPSTATSLEEVSALSSICKGLVEFPPDLQLMSLQTLQHMFNNGLTLSKVKEGESVGQGLAACLSADANPEAVELAAGICAALCKFKLYCDVFDRFIIPPLVKILAKNTFAPSGLIANVCLSILNLCQNSTCRKLLIQENGHDVILKLLSSDDEISKLSLQILIKVAQDLTGVNSILGSNADHLVKIVELLPPSPLRSQELTDLAFQLLTLLSVSQEMDLLVQMPGFMDKILSSSTHTDDDNRYEAVLSNIAEAGGKSAKAMWARVNKRGSVSAALQLLQKAKTSQVREEAVKALAAACEARPEEAVASIVESNSVFAIADLLSGPKPAMQQSAIVVLSHCANSAVVREGLVKRLETLLKLLVSYSPVVVQTSISIIERLSTSTQGFWDEIQSEKLRKLSLDCFARLLSRHALESTLQVQVASLLSQTLSHFEDLTKEEKATLGQALHTTVTLLKSDIEVGLQCVVQLTSSLPEIVAQLSRYPWLLSTLAQPLTGSKRQCLDALQLLELLVGHDDISDTSMQLFNDANGVTALLHAMDYAGPEHAMACMKLLSRIANGTTKMRKHIAGCGEVLKHVERMLAGAMASQSKGEDQLAVDDANTEDEVETVAGVVAAENVDMTIVCRGIEIVAGLAELFCLRQELISYGKLVLMLLKLLGSASVDSDLAFAILSALRRLVSQLLPSQRTILHETLVGHVIPRFLCDDDANLPVVEQCVWILITLNLTTPEQTSAIIELIPKLFTDPKTAEPALTLLTVLTRSSEAAQLAVSSNVIPTLGGTIARAKKAENNRVVVAALDCLYQICLHPCALEYFGSGRGDAVFGVIKSMTAQTSPKASRFENESHAIGMRLLSQLGLSVTSQNETKAIANSRKRLKEQAKKVEDEAKKLKEQTLKAQVVAASPSYGNPPAYHSALKKSVASLGPPSTPPPPISAVTKPLLQPATPRTALADEISPPSPPPPAVSPTDTTTAAKPPSDPPAPNQPSPYTPAGNGNFGPTGVGAPPRNVHATTNSVSVAGPYNGGPAPSVASPYTASAPYNGSASVPAPVNPKPLPAPYTAPPMDTSYHTEAPPSYPGPTSKYSTPPEPSYNSNPNYGVPNTYTDNVGSVGYDALSRQSGFTTESHHDAPLDTHNQIPEADEPPADVVSLMELGFEQSRCEIALATANGDVSTAAQLLFGETISGPSAAEHHTEERETKRDDNAPASNSHAAAAAAAATADEFVPFSIDEQDVRMNGWLGRKSKVLKLVRKRFFVLKGVTLSTYLKKPESLSELKDDDAKDRIKITIDSTLKEAPKKANSFILSVEEDNGRGKKTTEIFFEASDNSTKDRWMQALRKCIDDVQRLEDEKEGREIQDKVKQLTALGYSPAAAEAALGAAAGDIGGAVDFLLSESGGGGGAAAASAAAGGGAWGGGNAPADSTQYTGDKTCRVQIPRGAKPGQSVEVTADNGRRYRITIPKGKKGGDYVQMAY